MCGPRKHNCQPFCGPEGRFDCSDSVFSLRPAPLSYLCVRLRILDVLKIVCCCRIKPVCRRSLLWSRFLTDSAACVPSFYAPPLHYNNNNKRELIERVRYLKALYNLKKNIQCTNTHNYTNQWYTSVQNIRKLTSLYKP